MRRLAAGLAALLLSALPARATLYIAERDGAAYLSGLFEKADVERFAAFLADARGRGIRVIYLDSLGGEVAAGIAIGKLIRKAGLATAVDAARARCDSACTLIFAGGVKRHYIGGADVFEGFSGRGGLGYHPAHSRDGAWTRAEASARGTAMMTAHYRAMGQPGAAEMMRRAGFSSTFRPSGATALALRIATTLEAP